MRAESSIDGILDLLDPFGPSRVGRISGTYPFLPSSLWLFPGDGDTMFLAAAGRPGKILARLETSGGYPSTDRPDAFKGAVVSISVPPETAWAGASFPDAPGGAGAVSPFPESDTALLSGIEDSSSGASVSVYMSKKSLSPILDACGVFGAVPVYAEPFWFTMGRGVEAMKRAGRLDAERKGTGRIAVFVSSSGRIQGCVFADGLPVGQAASPPGHGAAEQLFRRLAQTVRNARRTPDETLFVPVIVESGERDTHGDVLETTEKFGLRAEVFSYAEMLTAGFGK